MLPFESSPRTVARLTGALFLVTIVAGIVAQMFISARITVWNDAAVTGANILANQSTWRLGFSIYLIEMAAQLGMTISFYFLLRPVSRPLSWAAAMFGIVGCTIKTMSRVFYYAPLFLLGGGGTLASFSPEQLQSLSMVLLRVNDAGAALALAFFGFSTLIKGILLLRATFLPRFLGVLSVLGGIGWLAYISPSLGNQLFPFIALVGLIGSVATIGWLLAVGVNEEKWLAQARASVTSIWA